MSISPLAVTSSGDSGGGFDRDGFVRGLQAGAVRKGFSGSRVDSAAAGAARPLQDLGGGFGEFGVHQGELDLGDAHRGALHRAVEDAVRHALGAEELVALFAQDPGDGIHDIGFAAAVGADDAGDPRAAEGDVGLLAERLKA